jgi:hypothetical protein
MRFRKKAMIVKRAPPPVLRPIFFFALSLALLALPLFAQDSQNPPRQDSENADTSGQDTPVLLPHFESDRIWLTG